MRTAGYQSEFTQFIKALKAAHPELEPQQQEGRDLLWRDQTMSLEDSARLRANLVPQAPYVYQTL